jgi:hypothetical protein
LSSSVATLGPLERVPERGLLGPSTSPDAVPEVLMGQFRAIVGGSPAIAGAITLGG